MCANVHVLKTKTFPLFLYNEVELLLLLDGIIVQRGKHYERTSVSLKIMSIMMYRDGLTLSASVMYFLVPFAVEVFFDKFLCTSIINE